MNGYYLERLHHDQRFWISTGLLFIIVNAETFIDFVQGLNYSYPFMTFLAAISFGHITAMLVSWILPLYLFMGPARWLGTDLDSGYDNFLKARTNRKPIFIQGSIFVFVIEFCRWLVLILSNVIIAFIFCSHSSDYGQYDVITDLHSWQFLYWQLQHQIITLLLFAMFYSLLAAAFAVLIFWIGGITWRTQYMYIVAAGIWFVLSTGSSSLMNLMQAFVEFRIKDLLIVLALLILVEFVAAIISWWRVVHYDNIG